jgi:hypothetical protein
MQAFGFYLGWICMVAAAFSIAIFFQEWLGLVLVFLYAAYIVERAFLISAGEFAEARESEKRIRL